MIRTLLVDDEEPARERLKQLLQPYEDIEIVGEAGDGEEAIDKIVELAPDLVFLDIQMPAGSGIEVASSLPSPRPVIIFCTAYDQYAVEAFEVHAVDYLLKPVNRSRLAKAVDHVRRVSAEEADARLEKATRMPGSTPARFLGKRANRFHVIPQDDVVYFVSEGGLTKLCTENDHYWVQPTMSELENRIDSSIFFRISRSIIVNLNAVKQVAPLVGGFGEVVLSHGARLDVSRRRFKALMEKLEKP